MRRSYRVGPGDASAATQRSQHDPFGWVVGTKGLKDGRCRIDLVVVSGLVPTDHHP
jgi:hypothetical protein